MTDEEQSDVKFLKAHSEGFADGKKTRETEVKILEAKVKSLLLQRNEQAKRIVNLQDALWRGDK